MRNNLVITFFLLIGTLCFAQKKITWDDLSKVTFTEKYNVKYKMNFLEPDFSDSVKALEGKKILISGFFLNIDPEKKMYVLSKGPMSACFFCGIGGPETAMELEFKDNQNIKTDAIVLVSGTLKLNDTDIEHFNYILTDCEATVLND